MLVISLSFILPLHGGHCDTHSFDGKVEIQKEYGFPHTQVPSTL